MISYGLFGSDHRCNTGPIQQALIVIKLSSYSSGFVFDDFMEHVRLVLQCWTGGTSVLVSKKATILQKSNNRWGFFDGFLINRFFSTPHIGILQSLDMQRSPINDFPVLLSYSSRMFLSFPEYFLALFRDLNCREKTLLMVPVSKPVKVHWIKIN